MNSYTADVTPKQPTASATFQVTVKATNTKHALRMVWAQWPRESHVVGNVREKGNE